MQREPPSPPPSLSPSSDDDDNGTAPAAAPRRMCLKCGEHAIEFETSTCHHACFCRACAMKCASGGRCKQCNQFYDTLARIR